MISDKLISVTKLPANPYTCHFSHKALDFWLTYVHNQESLLARHYTPDSFLYLSATAGRGLFLDLTTALQPLAQLPLRLEYQLEYQILQQQEQKRLADYLLDKHVANAEHSHLESHQALVNNVNMNSESTRASAQSQVKGEFFLLYCLFRREKNMMRDFQLYFFFSFFIESISCDLQDLPGAVYKIFSRIPTFFK